MCDPVSIAVGTALGAKGSAVAVGMVGASTMLGAASGVTSFVGQRQQAKQQARYQAQAAAAERQRFQQEQTSMRMRQAQEQEAVGRELEQVSRKSQAALARARVSAGEAGVAGASVQALMDDYMRQEAGYRSALLRQQEMGALATGLGLEQAGFATQQRQIGINQPINRPSFLSGALSTLQGGLSGARTGLTIQGMMGGGGGSLSQAQQFSSPGVAPVNTYRGSTGGTMLQDGYKLF
jgi:hypothetical protein